MHSINQALTFKAMSFTNKVFVVTGAGSGIGEAIAVHFAKHCSTLSLIDINSENISKVAERCKNLNGASVLKLVTDVSKEQELIQAVDKTIEEFGQIDVVINCAGICIGKGILDSELVRRFDEIINVNLRAMVILTHYAANALIASKGCIINIASAVGHFACKNTYDALPYDVSKAAVLHFTKSVALELADKGVRANSISPGVVKTNILLHAGMSEEENSRYWKEFVKRGSMYQLVLVEDIAELAGYLASDKAKCITGADFLIDHGWTLAGVN